MLEITYNRFGFRPRKTLPWGHLELGPPLDTLVFYPTTELAIGTPWNMILGPPSRRK